MKIVLVGNQNCGKSTLFNLLTDLNQKIGNWPGVTVEKKSGFIKGSSNELIDLPGIYSLSPYSEEEKVSRDFLLNEEIDLIINVVDCTSIERSLYLTTQLKELDIPVIVVLNMIDLASKKGIVIDKEELKKQLNVSVVEVSALKCVGIDELLMQINSNNKIGQCNIFDSYLEEKIEFISNNINCKHSRFYSVKSIEEDEVCVKFIDKYQTDINLIKSKYNFEMVEVIAGKRYDFIEKVKGKCVLSKENNESVNDKLDKIFLNRWLALPIFTFIMFSIYYLSVGIVGGATVDFLNNFVTKIKLKSKTFLRSISVSSWLISLIVDGIISGVGSVLNFVPQLAILLLCISVLEVSGYMSRIAFILDMLFKKIGLSGKTLVPFIVGSGCSVPGVMSTRIIENKSEREKAIILTPFIPCSAKLPIISLFGGYFFPNKAGFFCVSLYFLSIFIIVMLAIFLKKFVYKEQSETFINELPEYKIPNLKYVVKDVNEKVVSFLKRVGSVIFLSSIVIWFLLSFSFKLEFGVSVENSILANVGKVFSFVLYPIIGEFSWGATVSVIQGLVAKEQVVSSMVIISNMSNESLLFNSETFNFFSTSSAYAYVAFNLFSAPCASAIGAMKKELVSIKKVLFAVIIQIIVAWIVAFVIRVIGVLLGG